MGRALTPITLAVAMRSPGIAPATRRWLEQCWLGKVDGAIADPSLLFVLSTDIQRSVHITEAHGLVLTLEHDDDNRHCFEVALALGLSGISEIVVIGLAGPSSSQEQEGSALRCPSHIIQECALIHSVFPDVPASVFVFDPRDKELYFVDDLR